MARLFLHVGFGKTGTTTIQRYFSRKPHEDRLRVLEAGKQGFAHHGIAAAVLDERRSDWLEDYSLGRLKREVAAIRETTSVDAWASSEALSSTRMPRARGADKLREAFAGWDVNIIVYVRNQIDRVESSYLQKTKLGRFEQSFDDYVANILRRSGGHSRIVEHYRGTFGKEKVHVVSYDENRKDIFQPIERITGVEINRSLLEDRNVSGSIRSALVLQSIARDLGRQLNGQPWGRVRRMAEEALAGEKRQTLMTAKIAEQIAAHFRADNEKLRDLTGIDLNRYMVFRTDRELVQQADMNLGAGKSAIIAKLLEMSPRKRRPHRRKRLQRPVRNREAGEAAGKRPRRQV